MGWNTKYTDEHKQAIANLWEKDGLSASQIAARINQMFGLAVTRSGVIGVAHRLGLPRRATTGPWRQPQPRTPKPPQKPKPSLPPANLDQPVPIGLVGEMPADKACKWPVNDSGEYQACGHPQFAKGPYCEHHAARARGAQPKPMVGTSRSDRAFR